MSTNQYIKTFLEALGFKSKNEIQYSKEYKLQSYTISADISKGKIIYRKDDNITIERVEDGQIQQGDKTSSHFKIDQNPTLQESFVVLECVDRLLNKGYFPNDMHLERRYPSGRGASGGKSDICVYGKDGKSLMVIECKTSGAEYEKERKKMEEHGGQLFAYLANDQNAKFLVLYASKLNDDNKFDYENLIVQVKDREEDLKKSTKQIEEENIKLYRDAKNKAELFEVWKESFNLYFHFNGIFDDDANAYSLELKALKKKNLKSLEDSQGLFNKFAEILRHNNISDNANAFNKILSLFLCKIVDEEKNDDDVLDFQVKEDEEYEHIIDILQALYQKGMKKLNEEIVYYSEKELHEIIKLYPKQTPIESIEAVFRELKYYTNNEFAFKEVHNKKLFIQNGRVLTEVIKLLQNYKFKYTSKFQVLGEFFELMLNHGVKQSEGQFFTPIPIVRYIILSLGFEKIIADKIANDEDYLLPKILDYACGAGHFLTESIEELQTVIKKYDTSKLSEEQQKKFKEFRKGTEWTEDYIYGIEKDYRLARTSQIACYINGDGDANIIFGDGLEEHDQLKLEKKKFDIVVANPPYSVKAFKNYLNVGKTHFNLFDNLTERSKEIEVLFIERTKQVLADKGLAGIVLPSTILTNTGVYTKAREIILRHFEVKAITELGSKTFIATGTTTVILFLKRRNDDFVKDREYIAEDVFNGVNIDNNKRYIKERRFIELFCEHRELNLDDYIRFLKIEINDELHKTEMFTEYKTAFDKSTEIKNLKTKAFFKALKPKDQEDELSKRFYNFCKSIEKEKFLYFMLCLSDGEKKPESLNKYYLPQKTLIVKTGGEVNEQKEYLGYEFQGEKGSEGIKINQIGGKLYDDNNYVNLEKASTYVRAINTKDSILKISDSQKNNITVYNLPDLIDFNRIDFDKIIKTNAEKLIEIETQYPKLKLGSVANIIKGVTYGSQDQTNNVTNNIILTADNITLEGKFVLNKEIYLKNEVVLDDSKKLKKNDVFICFSSGSINHLGKVAFIEQDTNYFAGGFMGILRANPTQCLPLYLFTLLNNELYRNIIRNIGTGSNIQNLSSKINDIKIPVPPIKTQEKIILEIAKVDKKENQNISALEKTEKEIFDTLNQFSKGKKKVKLDKVVTVQSGGTPETGVPEYWDNGTINWLRSEVCQNCYVYESDVKKKITEEGLAKSSAKLLKPNTVLMALVGATIGRLAYLTFESTTNQNVTGLYPKDENELIPKYLFYALMNDFDKNFGDRKSKFTMANLTMIKNLEIPLLTYTEQKKLVDIIESKEKEIEAIKLTLANIKSEKEAVLTKHL